MKIILSSLLLFLSVSRGQENVLLDDFSLLKGWKEFISEGVTLDYNSTDGYKEKGIKIDYNFVTGAGYGGIQKYFPIDLPENFEFSFYIKASSPQNNFEIKFLDSSGTNVWWVNNRNFKFPTDWKKFTIKKRHIQFAWGPTKERELKRIDRIEFTIASFNGGSGSIIIDELMFKELPAVTDLDIQPSFKLVKPNSEIINLNNLSDRNFISGEIIRSSDSIKIDLNQNKEIDGLNLYWDSLNFPTAFQLFISEDEKKWEKVFEVKNSMTSSHFIPLKETQTRFIKVSIDNPDDKVCKLNEIVINEIGYASNYNGFLINVAKEFPRGFFPRYFNEEKSYWTVTGANNDRKETMINEEGMIETDKLSFSLEPFLKVDKKLYTWSDVKFTQSLEDDYLPIPKVTWNIKDITLETKLFVDGKANQNSTLYASYKISNKSEEVIDGEFYLVIRPFQVNPFYQELNITGGFSPIFSLKETNKGILINDQRVVLPLTQYDKFSALSFSQGNIIDLINKDTLPEQTDIVDELELGSGVIKYSYKLNPGEYKSHYVAVPFYSEIDDKNILNNKEDIDSSVQHKFSEVKNFWIKKLNYIEFNLPESADKLIDVIRSNIAYILINRDNAGIQPGSRSYERSWIRDGSLTSSALLKMGIVNEVKEFIDWFSPYQFESGKVPCVVDHRGPDPVPEHDSHGQLIYLIKQYFSYTKDTLFLKSKFDYVLNAVNYLDYLISQRSTDYYKSNGDSIRAFYGILPESISHEGYSEKPMHSYWDNFFAMKGLKDAYEIANILQEYEKADRIKKLRDDFKFNLYNSIDLATKSKKINYIPGCVELGDFDATSTTIALYPVNEFNNLSKEMLHNTFNKYYEFFIEREKGKRNWINYTPYEVRVIGSFILMDEIERAHHLIEYFLNDQRPKEWNHWAEVVWNDYRNPKFIGDMPHTWVGSDFINAIRSLFVYENEYDTSLVIGAGLYEDWIDSKNGINIKNLPTYYGDISYSIRNMNNKYEIELSGDLKMPKTKIILKNDHLFDGADKIFVNDNEVQITGNYLLINNFPAKIVIKSKREINHD